MIYTSSTRDSGWERRGGMTCVQTEKGGEAGAVRTYFFTKIMRNLMIGCYMKVAVKMPHN